MYLTFQFSSVLTFSWCWYFFFLYQVQERHHISTSQRWLHVPLRPLQPLLQAPRYLLPGTSQLSRSSRSTSHFHLAIQFLIPIRNLNAKSPSQSSQPDFDNATDDADTSHTRMRQNVSLTIHYALQTLSGRMVASEKVKRANLTRRAEVRRYQCLGSIGSWIWVNIALCWHMSLWGLGWKYWD
jgi:hypothetical protein